MVIYPLGSGMSDNEKVPQNAGRSLEEEPVVSGLVVLASQGKSLNIQECFTSARNSTNQNHHLQDTNHQHHLRHQHQEDRPQQDLNQALPALRKLPYQLFQSLAAQKIWRQGSRRIPSYMSQTMKSEYFPNGGSFSNQKTVTINPSCR